MSLLGPLRLQVPIGNLLLLEYLNQSFGGTLFDIDRPRQLGIRESGDIELGIAVRERCPRALDRRHLRMGHLAVSHRRRVAVLVLQQLHPFADLIPGAVAATLPLPVAIHWTGK